MQRRLRPIAVLFLRHIHHTHSEIYRLSADQCGPVARPRGRRTAHKVSVDHREPLRHIDIFRRNGGADDVQHPREAKDPDDRQAGVDLPRPAAAMA